MTDPTSTALSHLSTLSKSHPDLSSHYDNLSSLYSKKLWHQFTVSSLAFLSDPSTLRPYDNSTNHSTLFTQVILPIDSKLNSLCLARMASLVAFALPDGASLLTSLLAKEEQFTPASKLYLASRLGLYNLLRLERSGDVSSESALLQLEQIAASIETNRTTLRELSDTESFGEAAIVHSSHYEMAMMYRKAVGPPELYYRECIQYAAYTDASEWNDEKKRELAVDLSLAALTGEGVFNFGEILASPILDSLKEDDECGYLAELLECGSRGDVPGFQRAAESNADKIALQPSLVSRADAVKEKITLLALVNMVFERPSLERTLQFDDIAMRTCVSLDQVEWVVMRALSLNLIKGTMDQCQQSVDVTWVMPRVLNAAQMGELAGRFGEWAVKVSKTRDFMLDNAGALLGQ